MQEISLVTKCFIRNNTGELLVLKRSMDSIVRPGGWDLAGGRVDQDEDPNKAMMREISEETQLAVDGLRIIYVASEVDNAFIVTLFYLAQYKEQTLLLSEEHSEYQWITEEEFKLLDLPEKFLSASTYIH